MRLTPEREKTYRLNHSKPYKDCDVCELLAEIDALRDENASLKLRLGELSPDAKISWGHTGPCQPGCNCIDAQAASIQSGETK